MRIKLFLISVVGVLCGLTAVSAMAETVRITNGEWPPFTSEQLAYRGLLSRIVSEAFALEGVTVEYGFFPWKRAYAYAKNGKWDGSVGWASNARHRQDFHMSNPVILVDKALFHLKSTPFDWKTVDDLSRWRVGAAAGYSYGSEWDQAVKAGHLHVDEVALDEQNIKKLLLKRIDVAAMEVDVADYLAQSLLGPKEAGLLTRHPLRLTQTPICLALSRQLETSPGLLERFNRGLRRLKESGKYDQYQAEFRQANHSGIKPGQRPDTVRGQ